uniref:Urea carboxylase n=1 Tax=Cyanothece sp. (strain PCC 7425 / ATCC 29141) TaxID=395961 RepID=B8HW84_CYAP4
MFTKVLIANRGEIACRVLRSLDRLGIASVVVYSEADATAPHVLQAKEAVCLGPAPVGESYLRGDRILDIALQTGAEAIHPGYGFLSENVEFASRCEQQGIAFIGPTPEQIRAFGLKHTARALAEQQGVPLVPGTDLLDTLVEAQTAARAIGYPVMLKSTAGGGGIGMQVCRDEAELIAGYEKVQRLSQTNFKQRGVYLEKYLQTARHIEVQIFGDGQGQVVALGERDCSTQRRNQKVIEETPAPGISEALRQALYSAAIRLGKAVNYRSAGTVEFILDVESEQFYFLEVNTRLQVEHGITEAVTGLDLVEWMLRVAAGETDFLRSPLPKPQGHAIQVRLYAEDPQLNFQPSSGTLTAVQFPPEVRCDHWIETGTEVTPFYDPLLAKLIVRGENRNAAIANLKAALQGTEIAGIETNLDYLRQVVADPLFQSSLSTRLLTQIAYQPRTISVLDPGTFTTIQDYPGRMGYWDIGVPPSGPMDHLAFRLANRLLNNPEAAAALECTVTGPTLRFHTDTVICLTGAAMKATLDGHPIPYWQAVHVNAGSTLKLKSIQGAGYRTYLAVQGGFDVPAYLGSRATFNLGQFGGHGGRTLRTGDVLRLFSQSMTADRPLDFPSLAPELVPVYSHNWEIGVLYGPHGAPDFFTTADIEMFFSTEWIVHHNSARTGVRLIGPKPQWARPDGGEAGLHPSNIHDNAYAIGTIDFTGDMPIILGPDGPSLGGFVCPATIVQAELWKIGQLRPGDRVRFYPFSLEQAQQQERDQDQFIQQLTLSQSIDPIQLSLPATPAILEQIPASPDQIAVTYRPSGDKYLLVEYGPLVLDLNLRFRVHTLMEWLQAHPLPGIWDLTPGIRSLQIHYDSRVLSCSELLSVLKAAEAELPPISSLSVPTRIVHLPLSWDDPATQLAIQKYIQSVRPDAPWCPSNLEFIRRINGLDSIEQVREIVFSASYLVLGLGDVYLGAPVATPLDPRHRLVTTKYNPARTWTPENAVGIGGAYLCIYGMEGPGGYQFVGRTVQVWNRYKQTADFPAGRPWLLRFFDQIRFYPVSSQELLKLRSDFIAGKFKLEISETTFALGEYNNFLQTHAGEIAAFKAKQQAAFTAERQRWELAGEFDRQAAAEEDSSSIPAEEISLPDDTEAITAHISANIWQILVQPGDTVQEGDRLLILEAMKMEIAVVAEQTGTIVEVYCSQGQTVTAGKILLALRSTSVPA